MSDRVKRGAFLSEVEEEKVLWRDKKRWLFLGLPLTFTNYELTENKLRISTGFLKKVEDDIKLYRISDVTLYQTLSQRLARLGTLCVMSSDPSKPEIHLKNIKHARKLKDLMAQKIEEARKKSGVFTSEIVGPGAAKPPVAPAADQIHEQETEDTEH